MSNEQERLGHSLTALETLYYVIAGLAITDAIEKWLAAPVARLALLLLLGSTALRFIHGAATHFGTHRRAHKRPVVREQRKGRWNWIVDTAAYKYERGQALWDFVAFGVQAGAFVVLASIFEREAALGPFLLVYVLLLGWDTVWIRLTLAFDQDVKEDLVVRCALKQWIKSNLLVAIGFGMVYFLCPGGEQVQLWVCAAIGIFAFEEDYRRNSAYYFGRRAVARKTEEKKNLKRVVLESPFGGSAQDVAENVAYAKRCLHDCLQRGEAPIASHLLFTQRGVLLDSNAEQRKLGIAAGHAWLDVADLAVVYVDRGISKGMVAGLEEARRVGAKVEFRSVEGPLGDERRKELRGEFLPA